MGNKASQPLSEKTCYECNCERVMPEVIKGCCEAHGDGAENTFLTAIDEILGPNANLIVDQINQNDWVTTYSSYVQNINTSNATAIEPMSDNCKELNYCDCDAAAVKVIAECKAGADKAEDTIASIINENKDLFDGVNHIATGITGVTNPAFAAQESSVDSANNWVTKYFNPTRGVNIQEPSVESFEDIGLYKFVRQSLESRHRAFKDTPRFAEDCKTNATQSITKFLNDETNDLNTLYKYYITFVEDHKTLLLDRNSMTDIISGKVAILEDLQKKIDNYKTLSHVDNRKNTYLVSNYDFYKNIYFYMVIVYYSLFVLWLIFSKFISEKQYNNKKLVLILYIYLIIPIILSYLMNLIYEGYISTLEFYNLKEDTQTYNSLIEKMK
jgi:hypothetical protein